MQSPLPNVNKAFSLIVDHESQRNLAYASHAIPSTKIVKSTTLASVKERFVPCLGSGNHGHQPGGGGNPSKGHYDSQLRPTKS